MGDFDFDKVEEMLEGGGDTKKDDELGDPSKDRERRRSGTPDSEHRRADDGSRRRRDDESGGERDVDREKKSKRRHEDDGDSASRGAKDSDDDRDRDREKRKEKRRHRDKDDRGDRERSDRHRHRSDRDRSERKRRRDDSDEEPVRSEKSNRDEKDPDRKERRVEEVDDGRRRVNDVEEKKKREVEEARRDDLTVLILNLSLKAAEFDVWTFFSKNCGKVRDIQVIRDQRSAKSKGVGYVEFYTQEAVLKAMSMSGQQVLGQAIKVQASQAEKNRAARIAKQQQAEALDSGPMRIYVGGLVDQLANISEKELQELFRPFGDISSVDIHKDPVTQKCKGYGFVQFKRSSDAREAMASMNEMEIAGRKIKVGYATDSSNRGNNQTASAALQQSQLQMALTQQALDLVDGERLDDDGGGYLSGASTRIALMRRLQREGDLVGNDTVRGASTPLPSMLPTGGVFPLSLMMAQGVMAGPAPAPPVHSPYLRMDNMFTCDDVTSEGVGFFDDILDDVKEECGKHGSVVKGWVDRDKVDGRVWIKFASPEEALAAKNALSGRMFGGSEIKCETVPDELWEAATGLE
eukprot:GHVN01029664.1.p1 GENE.GHVN01029664.1~~GHVN01029664.1.p1  ORF type:complete len:579 (+),score=136.94 GHVN01029664.1:109-1845(+)